MPQISALEFERLPLRVHVFLAGVPLHDVWAVDLPRWRKGVTLDEFLRATSSARTAPARTSALTLSSCGRGAQTARGMKIVPPTNNVRLALERPGERAARRSTGKKCPRNWLRRRLARQTRWRRWKLPGTLSVERRSAQKPGYRSCFAAARRSQPEGHESTAQPLRAC